MQDSPCSYIICKATFSYIIKNFKTMTAEPSEGPFCAWLMGDCAGHTHIASPSYQ